MVDAMNTFGHRPFSGLYNADRVAETESWLGRNIQWTVLMASRDGAGTMLSNVRALMNPTSKNGIPAETSKRLRLVVTVPLAFGRQITAKTPAGQAKIRRLLTGTAAGQWDDAYTSVAKTLADHGHGASVIRLGHEQTGAWYPWSAVGNADAYKAAFRHVRDVMKSASLQLRFEYNTATSGFAEWASAAYPGSDVVDIIGLDIYNKSTGGKFPSPFEVKWKRKLHPMLVEHHKFAVANGKPVSYAEWANGSVDEPLFIHRMTDWFTSLPSSGPGALFYQCYFNASKQEYKLNNYPNSMDAYAKRFGAN